MEKDMENKCLENGCGGRGGPTPIGKILPVQRIKSHETIITITCLMIPMLNNLQKQRLLCFAVANRKICALRH